MGAYSKTKVTFVTATRWVLVPGCSGPASAVIYSVVSAWTIGSKTHFLNVDLELRATKELTELVKAFEPGATALNCMPLDDAYLANLELDTQPTEAEAAIRSFLKLIERLPPRARELWNTASSRDFSIGVGAGSTPSSFEIRADTRRAPTRRRRRSPNHFCRLRRRSRLDCFHVAQRRSGWPSRRHVGIMPAAVAAARGSRAPRRRQETFAACPARVAGGPGIPGRHSDGSRNRDSPRSSPGP